MEELVTGNDTLRGFVKEWLTWDRNENTLNEIRNLVSNQDVAELEKRLCNRLAFGTAGLRATMGAGYSMMNDLTIIQTTQGFAAYMLQATSSVQQRGVVVGYDGRHNSYRFAELVATVLVNQGIQVYLFSSITPTPYVPFAVLNLHCDWGIMITASHNPKQDNGYKVYFQNGSQIIPPHDKKIAASILENLMPEASSWDTDILKTSSLLSDPYDKIHASYINDVCKLSHSSATNKWSPIKFTYTAMHGVGYKFIKAAAAKFCFQPFIPVLQQVEPDPEFPTVKYPNPEEGKSALDLAIETANVNGSTVILANDPDADRLAVAEKQPSGSWHLFSGNAFGALIGWWLMTNYKTKHPSTPVSDLYCLASTVSSKMLRTICLKEGVNYEETLTGFKWMGNRAVELTNRGKTVLFAFEEAIGFMCGTTVPDKDGISAAMVAAEMATHLANQGVSLKQQLDKLHESYGYHVSNNSYFISYDASKTQDMFDQLRDYKGSKTYPTHCGPYKIRHVRDLTTGYDSSQPDNTALLPASKSSNMLTFYFENGCEVTIRTSGTEPKIKYYSEYCSTVEQSLTKEQVNAELDGLVENIVKHFYEPEKNGFTPRCS